MRDNGEFLSLQTMIPRTAYHSCYPFLRTTSGEGSHRRGHMNQLKGSDLRRNLILFTSLLVCCLVIQTFLTAGTPNVGAAGVSANANVPFSLALYSQGALTVPNSGAFNSANSLTVEAWLKPMSVVGTQTIVDRLPRDGSLRGGYQLRLEDGQLAFSVCTPNGAKTCPNARAPMALQPNRWQHVAAVFTQTRITLFVDGQPYSPRSRAAQAIGPIWDPLLIGAGPGGTSQFQGLLDEVRISNEAIYTGAFSPASALGNASSVVGLWRFDGATVNDMSKYAHPTSILGVVDFSTDVPSETVAGQFVLTSTPNVGPKNRLNDVVTIAADNVWAVGFHGPPAFCCFPATPVALRWNGTAWNNVPIPYPQGFVQGQLVSVDAAAGSTNVWALGTLRATAPGGYDRGWLIRWDGTQWNTVAVFADPAYPEYGIGTVKSLGVVSDSEVWIVGSRIGGNSWTLRWDGSSLSTIPSPNADMGGNGLSDISVVAADQIYAVGSFMAIRWNGSQWQILEGGNLLRNYHLGSVSAVSASEVWIVGRGSFCGPFQGCSSVDRIIRYDGSGGSIVAYEPFTQNQVTLSGVSASGPGDVWVVGTSESRGLVLHLEDGIFRRKVTQQSPPSASDFDWLFSVSALSPSVVFTVGVAFDVYYEPQYQSIETNYALRGTP